MEDGDEGGDEPPASLRVNRRGGGEQEGAKQQAYLSPGKRSGPWYPAPNRHSDQVKIAANKGKSQTLNSFDFGVFHPQFFIRLYSS